jgi:hypothetical protein
MKERFLLRGVAGKRGYVIYGHAKATGLIEADLANATLAFLNETTVTAGVTLQRPAFKVLSQFRRAFGGQRVEHLG